MISKNKCQCGKIKYKYSKSCLGCYRKVVENPLPRLLKYVIKTDSCWLWTGCTSKDGYGKTNLGIRIIRAHRAFYEIFKGQIPAKKCVCHKCDNRICVNPNHLWLGTVMDNHHDMMNKNRYRNGRTKLSETQIQEIRSSPNNVTYVALGKKYSISNVQARNVKLGLSPKFNTRLYAIHIGS